MSAGLRVQRAAPSDLCEVEALLDSAAAWLQGRGIDQWKQGRFASEVREAHEVGELFVAVQAAAMVGAFRLAAQTPVALEDWLIGRGRSRGAGAYLSRLVTVRHAAGRGLGVALLDSACGIAGQWGLSVVRLDCWAGNSRLRRYYLEAGFEHCGDLPESTRDRDGEVVLISVFERASP